MIFRCFAGVFQRFSERFSTLSIHIELITQNPLNLLGAVLLLITFIDIYR